MKQGLVGIYSQGSGAVIGWKIIKRRHQGKGDSGETDLAGFLPKAGRGDNMSRCFLLYLFQHFNQWRVGGFYLLCNAAATHAKCKAEHKNCFLSHIRYLLIKVSQ